MSPSPTTASLGADPATLEQVAVAFRRAARQLLARGPALDAARRTGWSGPDADRVARSLAVADRERHHLVAVLRQCATRLDRAVDRQRSASLAAPSVVVEVARASEGGRLVQRVGSSHAPVVVLLVPGVGTDPGDRERLRDDAVRVWRSLAAEVDDPSSVAVVSWLGYDPPDVILGAVDERPATEGAAELVRAVDALRAHGARRITVVGHSYGAVVAGRAAEHGMAADVLVQIGAPGVGAPGATDEIARRGIMHRAAREAGDPIALVTHLAAPIYGEDPVGRVTTLSTSGHGHGAYLHDARLLTQVADLAVGQGSWE